MKKSFAVAWVVIQELYRRKDFYVLFILTALITLLLGSVHFFREERIVGFLKEACLLLIWISMLAVAVVAAARQIPAEIEAKTIFPLLAKPIGRGSFFLGKFWGCWWASGFALLVFYVFFAVLTASREQGLHFAATLQAFWMHWVFLGLVIAMTLLGSVIFAAPSSNATIVLVITVGILMVGQHLHQVSAQMAGLGGAVAAAVYYAIPHLEFYDLRSVLIHNWESRAWGVVALASLYGAAYAACLLMAGWVVFRRKVLTQ